MLTTSFSQIDSGQPPLARSIRATPTLSVIVGFDGSESSRAALELAAQLIAGRNGQLEVVYVAHLPASVLMSADAVVRVRDGFDSIASELLDAVRATLDDREPRGHFHRRDGSVGHELVMAAREIRRQQGSDTTILIAVGSSEHLIHNIAGSVAAALTREEEFSVADGPSAQEWSPKLPRSELSSMPRNGGPYDY